jgi:starch phosphorylase
MTIEHFMPRELPAALQPLAELALDLRWNWSAMAKELWRHVDPDLWEATGNPMLILGTTSRARLNALSHDDAFLHHLALVLEGRQQYLNESTWFLQNHGGDKVSGIAYFSMEFGLTRAMPIYSGGLGILAGDLIKSASDMGVPLVGVGLLYLQGYFSQSLDPQGRQLAFYPFNDPLWLPVVPTLNPDGEWLRISLDLPGRSMILRVWQAQVGRVMLYLLDGNDPLNDPRDRAITAELYGGGPEQRIQQELVLGIGGWRLLEALGMKCEVCHLNEGHAAFAVLERARAYMGPTGMDFNSALCCTRPGNLFTTHTPVKAGFDVYSPRLMQQYLSEYAAELGLEFHELMALGRVHPEDDAEYFNMAWLAMRGSGAVNGVSRLHCSVSRSIFAPLFPGVPLPEIPVGYVTNGVHMPTWSSRATERLWRQACGENTWRGDAATLEQDFRMTSDAAIWSLRANARQRLVDWMRNRHRHQMMARGTSLKKWQEQADILNPDILTIGFARRFAAYKRPNLLLMDPNRLERLITDPHRPVQLVIAGKAHPQDEEGLLLIQQWIEFLNRPSVRLHAIFVEDYDMGIASELVHGVDLWLNTPLRTWEASGTSGMKVLVNGGLNLSELDGWWAEAYDPEVGWALGDGADQPAGPDWDRIESEKLYQLLEQEILPAFYERDAQGIPQGWLKRMRESMARLTGLFSSNRMLGQYTERYYLPAADAYRKRNSDSPQLAGSLAQWISHVRHCWPQVRIGSVVRDTQDDGHHVSAQVYLDGLAPEEVRLELYAEPTEPRGDPERVPMARGNALVGARDAYLYTALVPLQRPVQDYTVRIVPFHPDVRLPIELPLICWER